MRKKRADDENKNTRGSFLRERFCNQLTNWFFLPFPQMKQPAVPIPAIPQMTLS